MLESVLFWVMFPVLAGIAGGIVTAVRPPGPGLTSAVQHFAAGVVFAAAAGEILPDMLEGGHLGPVVVGFSAGVVLMLCLAAWERRADKRGAGSFPGAAIVAIGIDLVIDGFLIGMGFLAGEKQGLLLTFALTLEVLFLGLSVAALLSGVGIGRARIMGITTGLIFLTPLGAVVAVAASSFFQGSVLVAGLSFGCAALLYLVTEELLVEAHEAAPDTPFRAGMFYLGFLIVIVLEIGS